MPWTEGEKIPWGDPDFSRRMLAEHLSQDHDSASRRGATVARHVAWIHEVVLGGRPSRVLDLGCGPGLYTGGLDSDPGQVLRRARAGMSGPARGPRPRLAPRPRPSPPDLDDRRRGSVLRWAPPRVDGVVLARRRPGGDPNDREAHDAATGRVDLHVEHLRAYDDTTIDGLLAEAGFVEPTRHPSLTGSAADAADGLYGLVATRPA